MHIKRIAILLALLLPLLGFTPAVADRYFLPSPADVQPIVLRNMPHSTSAMLVFSIWRTAPLEVAKVFGRAPGCADADSELIEMTAKAAIETNLDPAILAATVATESSCNPYAVSSRGAVGYTQIMVKIWSVKFDFGHEVNLFNKRDNLHTGAVIMAGLINQYGTQAGIQRYNGVGVGCDSCDSGYSSRILALAHKQ